MILDKTRSVEAEKVKFKKKKKNCLRRVMPESKTEIKADAERDVRLVTACWKAVADSEELRSVPVSVEYRQVEMLVSFVWDLYFTSSHFNKSIK